MVRQELDEKTQYDTLQDVSFCHASPIVKQTLMKSVRIFRSTEIREFEVFSIPRYITITTAGG